MRFYHVSTIIVPAAAVLFLAGACEPPSTSGGAGPGGFGGEPPDAGPPDAPTFVTDGGGACLLSCEDDAGALAGGFDTFYRYDLLNVCGCHGGPCTSVCAPSVCDNPPSLTTGDACDVCIRDEAETWSPCAVRAAALCANPNELQGFCGLFAACVFACATIPYVGEECDTTMLDGGAPIPSCSMGLRCAGGSCGNLSCTPGTCQPSP